MVIELFYKKIKNVIQKHGVTHSPFYSLNTSFLIFLDDIMKSNKEDPALQITRMTILFEGVYQIIPQDTFLKMRLRHVRLSRWKNHYGIPPISFLLSFYSEIENTGQSIASNLPLRPWLIAQSECFSIDKQNNILINPQFLSSITLPEVQENEFQKTYNPIGGFTIGPCDRVSQQFIEYASTLSKGKGTLLEIGAAFGMASLQALAKGATVFCNDIDPRNLAVVYKRREMNDYSTDAQLVLLPGAFPEELVKLPHHFFDAILICRVLHFFKGQQIEKSLKQLFTHLKPGGKLFIVCETPFLKNWQAFILEYEKRKKKKIKWPGEINNPMQYETSGRSSALPSFVHWITQEVLEKSLKKAKFKIDYLAYMDRKNQFPTDLLFDGRESIGAIAVKPW